MGRGRVRGEGGGVRVDMIKEIWGGAGGVGLVGGGGGGSGWM